MTTDGNFYTDWETGVSGWGREIGPFEIAAMCVGDPVIYVD